MGSSLSGVGVRRDALARLCPACGLVKPKSQFYRNGLRRRSVCISCTKERQRNRYADATTGYKAWCQAYWSSDRGKDVWLRCKYGIGLTEVRGMARSQGHKCAICERRKPLAVDHAHKNRRVRGLLCDDCNVMLGRARDSVLVLARAITYLREG